MIHTFVMNYENDTEMNKIVELISRDILCSCLPDFLKIPLINPHQAKPRDKCAYFLTNLKKNFYLQKFNSKFYY